MNSVLSNAVGGVIAAIVFAVILWFWDGRKHRILEELTEIMGEAIKHRNLGRRGPEDEEKWVKKAQRIERKAVSKANELSTTAGALVEWLDKLDPFPRGNATRQYISILSKVIERIRELLERNS